LNSFSVFVISRPPALPPQHEKPRDSGVRSRRSPQASKRGKGLRRPWTVATDSLAEIEETRAMIAPYRSDAV
jgi:hypothetical protein